VSTAESFAPTLGYPVVGGARRRARVYVSSAARDLGDARAVVIDAIRRSGCEPVCMETYGADSRPPLERCLLDVSSCDVYVGIVAWRYGTCPPEQQKSFTHLEYEEAIRLRKQILLFHLHEEAAWPLMHVDQSQRDVRRLRDAQCRDHIVDHFSSVEQLSAGVRRALHRLYGEADTPVPALLPYVVDRHVQKERIAGAATRKELDSSPSLVVVHGAAGQAQHKFVEYMQEHLLARHLGNTGPVHTAAIALRSTEFDQPDVITRRIAGECCLDPTTDVDVLCRQLHEFGSMTMLRFPVEVETRRGRPQARRVAQLVEYFSRWPKLRPLRVLPVISAQYREPSSWSGRLLWGSAAPERFARAIEEAAAAMAGAIVVLPELTNVEQVEVEVWAEQAEVRRFLGGVDPIPMIRRMFHEHERRSKERGMPMEKLAVELTHLLYRRSLWQEA
jgi:hypothetical protein